MSNPNNFPTSTAPDGQTGWWSGKGAIPAVHSEVFVRMNSLGPAIVVRYQVVDGYLGLRVRFLSPPDWWKKQNAHLTGDDRLGLIFGAEIRNEEIHS